MNTNKNYIDALEKKATGFSATEVSEEYSVDETGELILTKRKVNTKYYPPDTTALKSLMDMDDLSELSDEELEKEKNRLLLELEKLGYDFEIADGVTLTTEQTNIVNKLLKCVENVHSEVITSHFPNIVEENVNIVDNRLLFSALSGKIVYPVALKYNGEVRKIRVYPTFIECDFSGTGTLYYCALLTSYTTETTLNDNMPKSLLADGVVAEYAYASNMVDSGSAHERKFLDGISKIKTHMGSGKIVRPRRWE